MQQRSGSANRDRPGRRPARLVFLGEERHPGPGRWGFLQRLNAVEGTVGPPGKATDSNGNPGSTDAALYPCPPTTAQQAAGDTCVVEMEIAGVVTSSPIYFTGQSIPTTTTTTTPGAPPCNPAPTTAAGPPSLTATPGTCLNGGTVVTLTGSGYDNGSLGTVLECNNASGQPTVALPAPISNNVPVSCSGISIANAKATTATGDLPAGLTFTIISPTPGPPCGAGYLITTCPTDSSGGNAATDAKAYPCPPTPAQTAAGASCTLDFGDEGGKTGTVDISFVPNATPSNGNPNTSSSSSSGSGSSAAGTGSTAATTGAATTPGSSLAFTGTGQDTWYTLLAALILLNLGFLLLTLYYRPRELLAMIRHGVGRTFGARE